ncbi:unnamed protein product [Thelazia callipaeda]|uniref:Tetraspanin n=1 Tax=Thelazia callipaeda TaxID=103827 RepID=A0A0N5D406_THECL|nr:unnamed protein product [Thelazia callipaeda]
MIQCILNRTVQKKLFIFCNTVFWVFGLGSLIIGLWSYASKQNYVDLTPSLYGTYSTIGLCVAAGLTVMIISVIGSFGVWTESRLLLLAYTFFVLFLLTIQFVISILALNYHSDIYRHIRYDMEQSLQNHKEVFVSGQITWDQMQTLFHCCGVDGPEDWFGIAKWPNSSYVPDSCCDVIYFSPNSSKENCGKGKENWFSWYYRGCSQVYTDWLFEEIRVVAYISIIFILIEFVLLGLLLLLFQSARLNRMSYNGTHHACNHSKGVSIELPQERLLSNITR